MHRFNPAISDAYYFAAQFGYVPHEALTAEMKTDGDQTDQGNQTDQSEPNSFTSHSSGALAQAIYIPALIITILMMIGGISMLMLNSTSREMQDMPTQSLNARIATPVYWKF